MRKVANVQQVRQCLVLTVSAGFTLSEVSNAGREYGTMFDLDLNVVFLLFSNTM